MKTKTKALQGILGLALVVAGVCTPGGARAEIDNIGFVDIGMPSPKEMIDHTETHPLGEYVIVYYQYNYFEPSVICCDDTEGLESLGVWCDASDGAMYWGDWPDYGCGEQWDGWDWSSGGVW